MNILIAGASGFIGKELVRNLSQNHTISVLGRRIEKLEKNFSKNITKLTWKNLNDYPATTYDIVINLAGSSIGAKRWDCEIKKELIESRTLTNKLLIDWLIQNKAKPRFFCANAIGIYAAEEISNQFLDEYSPLPLVPKDFLQKIGLAWEKSLSTAMDANISVTTLRFGVILKQGKGMLKKLEYPFNLGLGSILGNGEQTVTWIHYKDLINALNFLIASPDITGPINIVAPYPITQQEFAEQFAKILKRPLFLKTPPWIIKLLFGEMGEYLLLKGQKVVPTRLSELGFAFTYPTIEAALTELYSIGHNESGG
jgi:uncharacterized protein (TIGR01777 family)